MATKFKILLAVFSLVVAADQVTKYLAVSRLTNALDADNRRTLGQRVAGFYTLKNLDNDPYKPGGVDRRKPSYVVMKGYWNHKYVENPGAAWGLLAGQDDRFRVPFFHVVSLVAIVFIALFFRRLEPDQTLLAFALSLVWGGAIGNYLDRLARNYVVDFIDWHWHDLPGMHWPTFNVADCAICVGVVLMIGETLFGRRHLPQTEPATVGPLAPSGELPPPLPVPELPDPAALPETPAATSFPPAEILYMPAPGETLAPAEPEQKSPEPAVLPNGAHGNEEPN